MSKKRSLTLPQKDLQELDKKLQEFALMDFELFCKLAGIDKTQAFVCFEIQRKKSLRQIGIKMKLPKSTVYLIAKKCPANENANTQNAAVG